MSSTNKTLTIELSQYVGTDKPTYLSDYNGDMLKIDNAIAADRDSIATAQSKADGADAKADTNAGAIATLDGQINNASNGLTKRVTDVEGDVNTIESLIGNGTPTTTDKTIIGAINELAAEMPSGTATGTSYNNTDSGLTATNVQGAIDEIISDTAVLEIAANTYSTFGDAITPLATAFAALTNAEKRKAYIVWDSSILPCVDALGIFAKAQADLSAYFVLTINFTSSVWCSNGTGGATDYASRTQASAVGLYIRH